MVPAAFAVIDTLPLTRNGKIDRANLPPLDEGAVVDHRPFVAPRDDLERRLQTIWQELLNTSPIGVHDDFYAIGGHSLLAAKLLARIEGEFNRRIPLTAMFPAPTIESIAARIAGGTKDSEWPATETIQPLGCLPPLYVVGNFSRFKALGRKLGTDRPLIGLSIPDELRLRLPYNLKQLAGIQASSILDLNKGEPIFLIGFSAEGVLAYEIAHQLVAAGREVGLVAMIDTTCPSQRREPRILQIARSAAIHLRAIRSIGLGQSTRRDCGYSQSGSAEVEGSRMETREQSGHRARAAGAEASGRFGDGDGPRNAPLRPAVVPGSSDSLQANRQPGRSIQVRGLWLG